MPAAIVLPQRGTLLWSAWSEPGGAATCLRKEGTCRGGVKGQARVAEVGGAALLGGHVVRVWVTGSGV